MKRVVFNLLLALVASLVIAWTLFGVNSTWAQDATGEPAATVEAVPVATTDEAPAITVEDGGTLVINEQPAEPAPTPTVNPDLQAFLIAAVSLAFLFAFSLFGRDLIKAAKDNVPPWALEPIFSAVDSILSTVEATALATTSPADDAQVADLRKKYEELKAELRNKTEPGK